jgi:uncharacterized SAM-binding protein YcdF (DUF218 family)
MGTARAALRTGDLFRWTITGAAAALSLFIVGFAVFASNAMRETAPTTAVADGIVVLTGGDHRIHEGGRLLREGRGRRLLISGVNPLASRDDLIRLTGLEAPLFDCCVDIGYTARDTIGNAREAQTWVADRHLSSLLVVTSSSHTPRAMTVLAIALPTTVLVPNPVATKSHKRRAWWLQAETRRTLLIEYMKFLPAAALRAAMFLVPSSAPSTATASPVAPVARS